MGLQLRFVVGDVVDARLPVGLVFALAGIILLLVMLVRPMFVFSLYAQGALQKRGFEKHRAGSHRFRQRLKCAAASRRNRGLPPRRDFEPMIVPEAVVVSWPGIQAVTFTVAVGSLLLPEATLPAPIRRLHLPSDDTTRRDNDAQGLTAVRVASGRVVAEFARSPPPGIAPRCSSRSA